MSNNCEYVVKSSVTMCITAKLSTAYLVVFVYKWITYARLIF